MTKEIADFVSQLQTDSDFIKVADEIECAFDLLAEEAVTNQDAGQLLRAVSWIAGRADRTLLEKLEVLCKLLNLPPGPIVVNMAELTGWRA